MIVNSNFVISEDYLPSHVCDDIVQRAKDLQDIDGVTGHGLDTTVRNSRIVWLKDTWIYDWISPFIHESNKTLGWNFILSSVEDIQFTKYKEKQFYGWHQDGYNIPDKPNDLRKISVVIPLVDSESYEGGDLEFYDCLARPNSKEGYSNKVLKDERTRKKGSLIFFPSYVYHQVTPVTKGERLSIVIWYSGAPWR